MAAIYSAVRSTLNNSSGVQSVGSLNLEFSLIISKIINIDITSFFKQITPIFPKISIILETFHRGFIFSYHRNIELDIIQNILNFLFVINSKLQSRMIMNRAKQSKSETPVRANQQIHRVTPFLAGLKRSDPFLKQLKEVYDKQNINPNVKQTRIKSFQANKIQTVAQNRSPIKKNATSNNPKSNAKNNSVNSHQNKTLKEGQTLLTYAKFNHSSQLQNIPSKNKNSNRKSTQKDENHASDCQDEYYSSKQEKRQKRMKVTLKDLKKHRKSIQQSQSEYLSKGHGETKQTISPQSLIKSEIEKYQYKPNQHFIEPFEAIPIQKQNEKSKQCLCLKHPAKKATHQLIESNSKIEDKYFCEKCAVDLATKGFQLTQLAHTNRRLNTRNDSIKEERISQLKDFLFQLDKMEPIFQNASLKLINLKEAIVNKFQDQIKQITQYYEKTIDIIKTSFQSSLLSLKLHAGSVLQSLEANISHLQKLYLEIPSMKQDIIPNINQIIEQSNIQDESFKVVIQNYYKKLAEIDSEAKRITLNDYGFSYEFDYVKSQQMLLQICQMLVPVLRKKTMLKEFDTFRKNTEANSQEKIFDPFRMSFGKHINSNDSY